MLSSSNPSDSGTPPGLSLITFSLAGVTFSESSLVLEEAAHGCNKLPQAGIDWIHAIVHNGGKDNLADGGTENVAFSCSTVLGNIAMSSSESHSVDKPHHTDRKFRKGISTSSKFMGRILHQHNKAGK